MKRYKLILLILLGALIVIQFFHPTTNKSGENSSADLIKSVKVPDYLVGMLRTACYDCHSNNTIYPWYSSVQPLGWLLARHIRNGKAELNLSDFGSYSLRRQISKLDEIANSIKDRTMPLSSYTWLHPNARLTKKNKSHF